MSNTYRKLATALLSTIGLVLSSACTTSGLNDYTDAKSLGKISKPDQDDIHCSDRAFSLSDNRQAGGPERDSLSYDLFTRVNDYRKSRGLRKLKWNSEMAKIAEDHSRSMSSNRVLTHKGFSKRANAVRRTGVLTVGENLAYYRGKSDPASVALQLWIDSPTHFKNLAGKSYDVTGVGCSVNSEGYVYFSQLYGH